MKNCIIIQLIDTMHDEEEMADYIKNLRDAIGLADDKISLYNIVRRIIDHKKNFSLYYNNLISLIK